jgi:hypothetical protein
MKFTEWPQFFQTHDLIDSPYSMGKVHPYRFVPQTSYSVETIDRGRAAPELPLRSRFFICPTSAPGP